jgi:hypothetical protein
VDESVDDCGDDQGAEKKVAGFQDEVGKNTFERDIQQVAQELNG